MTAIVGVLCADGVVLGTDSSATFTAGQVRTIEQPTEKLHISAERIIVAGSGPVGLGQRFCAVVDRAWDEDVFKKDSPVEIGKALSKAAIEDMTETYVRLPGQYGALVAFPCRKKPYLCEFVANDFQPEVKTEDLWYASVGSAQPITDPFLGFMRNVFWKEGPPTVAGAVFAVTWTLDHAVDVNPGGVKDPVRIAVLQRAKKGRLRARMLDEKELAEHRVAITAAKETLRTFPKQLLPEAAADVELPEPELEGHR